MDEQMIDIISEKRLVPVVAIGDSAKAQGLAEALVEGGLPIAEITLRTSASFDAIKIAASNDRIFVGVGSLRSGEDLQKAVDLGAKFAVSAGFSLTVARKASELNIPYFPGVSTPTEILMALDCGLTTLKFFPAETLGGVSALKAMSAPFPGVAFMPTGGINIKNASDYLALDQVTAVGGSWMVQQQLIDGGDFEAISKLTREAVEVTTL